MINTDVTDLIRSYYHAYETGDRAAVEHLLSEDFTFTSPLDDRIDRATYFERCWRYHEQLRAFRLDQLVIDGNHALVRYEAEETAGTTFRNIEHFELNGQQRVTHIDVYFGALPDNDPNDT
jgi:ketosteroid isomerase-like protein